MLGCHAGMNLTTSAICTVRYALCMRTCHACNVVFLSCNALAAACRQPPAQCWIAGLLANLTCLQAELYEMESAMSVGEDPLWIIPYTTTADEFQDLLDDYTTYIDVGSLFLCHRLPSAVQPVSQCCWSACMHANILTGLSLGHWFSHQQGHVAN